MSWDWSYKSPLLHLIGLRGGGSMNSSGYTLSPNTACRRPSLPSALHHAYHRAMLLAILHVLAQGASVPIPIALDWAPVLLLTILWIFVAAAVVGPLLRRFRRL
jgi:hypothetical protein